MRILLTAINAKYIHSNLAVYSLRAYAIQQRHEYRGCVEIAEYTINQQVDEILMNLYALHPDVLCFSCYLWNIVYVEQLVKELGKILPDTEIWLGGPEVSHHAQNVLERLPQVRGVMCGEGEETFLELADHYNGKGKPLQEIDGIVYACSENIFVNPPRKGMDLNRVPFVYAPDLSAFSGVSDPAFSESREAMPQEGEMHFPAEDPMECFRNKILYYESSRGCPFSCSYCLSSIDKCLRFRNLDTVKKELQFFIDREVPQVKFVDRTFNCRHDHAFAIWSYLAEHDRGKTNFHFEVAADLLNEEQLELITSMRPRLIQLEIGVQSTNQNTLREIRRTMDFEKVGAAVRRIRSRGNIHQHLDLIAGLPFEDLKSFQKSFNDVYALHPEQLQLGFLKVLKGSYMEERAEGYELLYQDRPPFEVLSTKWLSYEDVIRLKGIEGGVSETQ